MTAIIREIKPESPELEDVLEAIARAATTLQVEVYLVGGFVRDRLLGGAQGKDIDLVTVGADPMMPLLAAVAASGFQLAPSPSDSSDSAPRRSVAARGSSRGCVPGRSATTPSRATPTSGRARSRRTSGAGISRSTRCARSLGGEVIDITGRGVADLLAGVLRTPLDPAVTFAEDPLRMYRAARFVARLGFSLAPGTIEAMRAQAEENRRSSPSSAVSDELRAACWSPHIRAAGIAVLRDGGLLSSSSCPELVDGAIGVEQGGFHTHDVYGHTLNTVDAAPPDLVTRTAALLHDIAKPPTHAVAGDGRHTFYDHPQIGADMARAILTRWRFSNDEISDVSRLVRLHLRPIQYDRYRDSFRGRGGAPADPRRRAAARQDARPRPSGHHGVRLPDPRGARRARRADGPPRRRRRGLRDVRPAAWRGARRAWSWRVAGQDPGWDARRQRSAKR